LKGYLKMDERLEILKNKNLLDVPLNEENIEKINLILENFSPDIINYPISLLFRFHEGDITSWMDSVSIVLSSGLSREMINFFLNKIGSSDFIYLIKNIKIKDLINIYNKSFTTQDTFDPELYDFIRKNYLLKYQQFSPEFINKMRLLEKELEEIGQPEFFSSYLIKLFNIFGEKINDFFRFFFDDPSFDIFNINRDIIMKIYDHYEKFPLAGYNSGLESGNLILEYYRRHGYDDFITRFILENIKRIPKEYRNDLDNALNKMLLNYSINGYKQLEDIKGPIVSEILKISISNREDIPANLTLAFKKSGDKEKTLNILKESINIKNINQVFVFDYLVENYSPDLWEILIKTPMIIGRSEKEIRRFDFDDRSLQNYLTFALFGEKEIDDQTKRHIQILLRYQDKYFFTAYQAEGLGDFILDLSNFYDFDYSFKRCLSFTFFTLWKTYLDKLKNLDFEEKLKFLFPEENNKFKNLNPVYFLYLNENPKVGEYISEENIKKHFKFIRDFYDNGNYMRDNFLFLFKVFQDDFEKIKNNWPEITYIYKNIRASLSDKIELFKSFILDYKSLLTNHKALIIKIIKLSQSTASPQDAIIDYLQFNGFSPEDLNGKSTAVLISYCLAPDFLSIDPDRIEKNFNNLINIKNIKDISLLMRYIKEEFDKIFLNNYYGDKFDFLIFPEDDRLPISQIAQDNLNNFIEFYKDDPVILSLPFVLDIISYILNGNNVGLDKTYNPLELISIHLNELHPEFFDKTIFYRNEPKLFPIIASYPQLIGINKKILNDYFLPILDSSNELERSSFASFISVFDKQISFFNINIERDLHSSELMQKIHDYNSYFPEFTFRYEVKYLGAFMLKYKNLLGYNNNNIRKIIKNWIEIPDEIKSTIDFDIINDYYIENFIINKYDIKNVEYKGLLSEAVSWGVEEYYDEIEKLYSIGQRVPLPQWTNIGIIETKNYSGYFLPRSDFRTMFIGNYVTCCQQIGGQAQSSAIHSQISPFGALFVVENKKKKTLSAQSWVWSNGDTIVFDNIESPSGKQGPSYNEKAMNEILDVYKTAAIAIKMANGDKGKVLIGNSRWGIDQEFLKSFERGPRGLVPEDADEDWIYMNDDDFFGDEEDGGPYRTNGGLYLDSYYNTVKVARVRKDLIRISNSIDRYATDIADCLEILVRLSV